MSASPIVLVPGFWLGAWAWDHVANALDDAGHRVLALTLPGLSSLDEDRSSVSFEDHVEAVSQAVAAAGQPVVLVVHSGAGGVGYAVSDRMPDLIAAMVYADSGPAGGPLDADFEGSEYPFPGIEQLAQDENLDGLSEEQLDEFAARAVPQPGGALRGGPELENPARLDVPTTMICTGFTSDQYKAAAADGHVWLAGLNELRDVTYVDLPTSHWPMWSRPADLAAILADIATRSA